MILLIDALFTVWGVIAYEKRAKAFIQNTATTVNPIVSIEKTLFPNETMRKTFPNLRFLNSQGEEVWIKDILTSP